MHRDIPSRHWHVNDPGVVPNLLQTGAGSPTGILVYEGSLLPDVFQGEVIHCDAGPSICRAYPVEKEGAGYTARIVNILDGARHNWFRPSDVCVAPDGSLIVADWYDPGVGGHRAGDLTRGRLFRVTAKDAARQYQTPQFDFSTSNGCIQALRNPNLAVRYMAWMQLHSMGKQAEPALVKMAADDDPRMRARALWLLGKMQGRGQKTVATAMQDEDADVRAMGVRLARQVAGDSDLDIARLLDAASADRSPQVRRECAIALADLGVDNAAETWAALASQHDGEDRWYLEALGIAARGRWDECLATWLDRVDGNWNSPASRDIIWRSRAKQTPALLAKIIQDEATPEGEKPRYFRAFDFLSGPEKDQALQSLLDF